MTQRFQAYYKSLEEEDWEYPTTIHIVKKENIMYPKREEKNIMWVKK